MKLAEAYLETLDENRDRKTYDAFTRLVREQTAPIHGGDLRPILEWLCTQLDDRREDIVMAYERLTKLEQRQDPNFHNPDNGT